MSVSATTSRISYVLSAADQTLAIPFLFLDVTNVQVLKVGNVNNTPLVINVDFTISGSNVTLIPTVGNGLAIGDEVVIRREVPLTQLVDYINNDRFNQTTHERAMDKLTMIAQMLAEELGRCIRVRSDEDAGMRLPTGENRAFAVVGFDENGSLTVYPVAELGGGGGGGAGFDSGALRKSNNLTDLTNAIAARLALGLGSAAVRNTAGGPGPDAGLAEVVMGDDTRLTNARTPTAHTATHKHGGSDEISTVTPTANAIPKADGTGKLASGWLPPAIGTGDVVGPAGSNNNEIALFNGTTGKLLKAGGLYGTAASRNVSGGGDAGTSEVVTGDDTRLTDQRTPTNASVTAAKVNDALKPSAGAAGATEALRALGTTATTACAGNDSRLADARTPSTHATSHKAAGADPIKLDEFAAPTDVTTLNATTAAHGLMPKAVNSTRKFYRSDMTQAFASSDVINVKDYGAVGDGTTDDNTAIQAAIVALPATGGVLYFPASSGAYRCARITMTGKTGLTICGDGKGVSKIKINTITDAGDGFGATPGGQVLNLPESNTYVEVFGLTFDGSCTHRKAGQQAVTIDGSYTHFHDNHTINSGEFANMFGRNNSTRATNVIVRNNTLGFNWADGINLHKIAHSLIEGNVVDGADDDLIAIGQSEDVLISNNVLKAGTSLVTSVGRGIAILDGASDIQVIGNKVFGTKQHGLLVQADGGSRVSKITIKNNVFRDCAINSGCGGRINQADHVMMEGNDFIDPSSGDCLQIADWQYLTIKGGNFQQTRNQYCRGIHCDEGSGATATWASLIIQGCTFKIVGAGTNESIYINNIGAGITLDKVAIIGCVAIQAGGNYIHLDPARVANAGRIINNSTINGNTISPSSTSGVVLVENNN